MKREWLERRILVPALVGYIVLLTLAGWRHEVRPSLFDPASDFARQTLALVGIPPAVAVFTSDAGSAPDAKIAAICLEVRALSEDGRSRQIYPAEGVSCPAPAPRLWVRGEDIFLHRAVVILRAAVAARQGGAEDRGRMRFAQLLARSIGAHFVRRGGDAPGGADRNMLLWKETRLSYSERTRSDRVVALFDWESTADPHVFIAWRPDAAKLVLHGWNPGPP